MRIKATLFAIAISGSVMAQGVGDFVADELVYDSQNETIELIANVEVDTDAGYFYLDYLHYDLKTGRIDVEGNLHIVSPDGGLTLADFGSLNRETEALVLRGVRTLLTNQMQLAATHFERDASYQYGEGVLASSCSVCLVRPAPLWQVRAQQVLLDTQADKIYVKNGTFELAGIPIAGIPRMRFPGPRGDALEGFLPPTLIFSDRFLTGLEIPYYWPIGDYADLKLNTKITTDDILVSDFRYRHNFPFGSIKLDGGYLFRDGESEAGRAFVNSRLGLNLPYDFDLDAQFTAASDRDFQPDFNFTQYNQNQLSLSRLTNDSRFNLAFSQYRALSEADKTKNLQTLAPYATYDTSVDIAKGWRLDVELSALSLEQSIDDDYQQFLSAVSLARADILPFGFVSEVELGASFRASRSENQFNDDDKIASEFRPTLSFDLAWPLIKSGENSTEKLTPRLGILSTQSVGINEFTPESISFVGADDYVGLFTNEIADYGLPFENATKVNFGIDYRVDFHSGRALDFAFGRSLSFNNDDGTRTRNLSEWVGYANYEDKNWGFKNRFGLDDNFELTRLETGFTYDGDGNDFEINWLRLVADPGIGVDTPVSALDLAGQWRVRQNWQLDYNIYYDLESSQPFDAGLSLVYGNECIEARAGAKWDFDKGNGILNEQSIAFNVKFLGLTAPATDKWGRQQCRK